MSRRWRVPAATAAAMAFGALLLTVTAGSERAPRLVGAAGASAVAIMVVRRLGDRRKGAGPPEPPDELEAVWRRGAERADLPQPPERERLQRLVRLSVSDADHAHRRLRPLLRDLADARLVAAYGTHLDRDPLAAARVGPIAWSWVRPDRPEPPDRHARGPDLDTVEEVVAAIEAIVAPQDRPREGGSR